MITKEQKQKILNKYFIMKTNIFGKKIYKCILTNGYNLFVNFKYKNKLKYYESQIYDWSFLDKIFTFYEETIWGHFIRCLEEHEKRTIEEIAENIIYDENTEALINHFIKDK